MKRFILLIAVVIGFLGTINGLELMISYQVFNLRLQTLVGDLLMLMVDGDS